VIDIIVIRDPGHIDGGEITSPLLSTVEVALERGRQEIEKHARARRVRLTTVFRTGVRKGHIVEVADSLQGPVWRGVILGLSHVVEGEQVYSVLDVERPA
jgi:hypothetical protein